MTTSKFMHGNNWSAGNQRTWKTRGDPQKLSAAIGPAHTSRSAVVRGRCPTFRERCPRSGQRARRGDRQTGKPVGGQANLRGQQVALRRAEELLDLSQHLHEAVYLRSRVVEKEAGASGRFHAELAHQGLVAVVPAAQRDAALVGHGHYVMRMDVL